MNKDKQIAKVMDNFDFEHARDIMARMHWTWVGTQNGVPTIREMKAQAERLLNEAIDSEVAGTGGFTAVFIKKNKSLMLFFGVEGDNFD